MTPLRNDPRITAIAQRVREFLLRQPGFSLRPLAEKLGIREDDLRSTLAPEQNLIDPGLLIDVITAVIHHYAVDPRWLLTGTYDAAAHRAAEARQHLDRGEVQRLLADEIPGLIPARDKLAP